MHRNTGMHENAYAAPRRVNAHQLGPPSLSLGAFMYGVWGVRGLEMYFIETAGLWMNVDEAHSYSCHEA